MCELFGLTGRDEINVYAYLKTFFSHSADHPNGWGMAFFRDEAVSLEKEPVRADKSRYLKERFNDPLFAANMFAHIRFATKGGENYNNCHPFVKRDGTGRTWTLMHNGTIFECPIIDTYFSAQDGSTDSERILLYIIDQIDLQTKALGHPLSKEQRFGVIDRVMCEITKPNNKVNLMLYDGELMYVHTNLPNTLRYKRINNSVVFSTEPLDENGWEQVELYTLTAYQKGEKLFTGTNHGNEYHYNYEDVKYLYLEHTGL